MALTPLNLNMADLHETLMGRKLIEHTLPEIARQLERVANALEKSDSRLIRLEERYKTLSELNADPKSVHHMHLKIREKLKETLKTLTIISEAK